jgi:hypothetical protein
MTHQTARRATITEISPILLMMPPVVATAVLRATSANPIETAAVVYAFLLLLMPWGSYLCWRQGRREDLPIFAMIAGAYWVYFALPLFWGERTFTVATKFAAITPSESSVTDATWMALVGVIGLWLGMRIPVSIWVPAHLPDILEHRLSWAYVRLVLLGGVIFGLDRNAVWLFGGEARQLMTTLVTVVPGVAFVLLFNRYLSGMSARIDRVVLLISGAALLLGGLASGWLGPVVSWGVICAALVLLKRRKFPWAPVILTIVLLVFLQVGKNEFRSVYWSDGGTEAGLTQRVQFWFEKSASIWGEAFQSGDREDALGLASRSLQRASLLTQVAHVLDMTPSQVPFQEGETYRFLIVTLIPRLFWPDKPTVNDANKFYQVAYGLTTEKGLAGVSIAVGSLAEGYINFGWFGAIGVMLLIGTVFGIYQRTFVLTQSSALFLAIGLTLIPGFLAVESQLGQYLGGIVQQIAVTVAVFLPVMRRSQSSRERSWQHLTSLPAFHS